MGQYYLLVNKTKKQFLYGNTFDDGIKAHEILWNGKMMKALGFLLLKSDSGDDADVTDKPLCGYWAGDEIILIGDYDSSKLYNEAEKGYLDISSTVINAMLNVDHPEYIFEDIKEMRKVVKDKPPIPFDELSKVGRPAHIPEPKIENNEPEFDPTALEIT